MAASVASSTRGEVAMTALVAQFLDGLLRLLLVDLLRDQFAVVEIPKVSQGSARRCVLEISLAPAVVAVVSEVTMLTALTKQKRLRPSPSRFSFSPAHARGLRVGRE